MLPIYVLLLSLNKLSFSISVTRFKFIKGEQSNGTFSFAYKNYVVAAIENKILDGLSIVLVSYSLLSSSQKQMIFIGPNAMRVDGIEFLML